MGSPHQSISTRTGRPLPHNQANNHRSKDLDNLKNLDNLDNTARLSEANSAMLAELSSELEDVKAELAASQPSLASLRAELTCLQKEVGRCSGVVATSSGSSGNNPATSVVSAKRGRGRPRKEESGTKVAVRRRRASLARGAKAKDS